MNDFAREEKQVDAYVSAGDTDAAVKLLFDLIVKNAKAKKFSKAEALRDRLFEVDDMALTEILRSGEIIEEEKTGGMDQNHLEIWSKLYGALTKEEANALYYSLEEESYDADVTLFEEGKPNSRILFINEGQLKMVYSAGDKEMLLKTLDKGNVAGDDTFFSFSNCSTSLITLSRVRLHALEEEALVKLEKNFPGLKSKLQDYCLKQEQVSDLLKSKNLDRRTQERLKLEGIVVFQLVKKSGELLGKPFKASLSDVSVGGMSFFIKTPKKETVRLLLGRKVNLKFTIPKAESGGQEDINGTVVGLCDHFFNDYSIHIKFENVMSDSALDPLKVEA